MKQKPFFVIFKGLSMNQIAQIFLEGESSTLRFSVLCDKNSAVFQLSIFDFKKLTIIGDTLNNSRDFIT